MIKIFFSFIFLFFIGCGGGSQDIENKHSLSPKVIITDLNLTSNILKGKLTFREDDSFYSNVFFKNISISAKDCNLNNVKLTKNLVKDGETLSFEAETQCSVIKNLQISFEEIAQYMDTSLKTVNKTFNLSYEVNIGNEVNKINVPTKLVLIPKKILVSSGAKYSIKIFTLDSQNRGVSSKVNISMPIDKDNEIWGNFDKSSVTTDENGEADIVFTATNNVEQLKEENLSVPISVENTSLIEYLVLEKPDVVNKEESYKLDYITPSSIEVDNKFDLIVKILSAKTNELISESNIKEVNFTSRNHLVYFDNNSSKFRKTLSNLNPMSIQVHSGIYSGIDVIDVNASIKDNNDTYKIVSSQIPIIIVSGPVNAISIISLGGKYNTETGLFEKTYTIHAVDKYSNPVKAGTKIKVGAVVGRKVSNNKGELTTNSDNFKDNNINFTNDLIGDSLIIFADANHRNPSYLGGWIVKNYIDSHTLQLSSIYEGDNVNNLSYVIGNEKRYMSCDATLAVADFDSSDKTYETNNQGIAKVILKYDPYLVGHTISLYANSYQDKRVGISLKDILEGEGVVYNPTGGIWSKDGVKNNTVSGNIYIGVKGGAYIHPNLDSKANTSLFKNVPVNLKVLTPSICKFTDGTVSKNLNTSCGGSVSFDVKYDENGTCQVGLSAVYFEY